MELNIILVAINTYSGAEDVAEAAEGMFREVGVKPNLVTMDVATRRARDRALEFDNHIQITGTSSDQFTGWRVYNSSFPPRYGLEDSFTNELFSRVRSEIDPEKRAPLWRELGEYSFVNPHVHPPLLAPRGGGHQPGDRGRVDVPGQHYGVLDARGEYQGQRVAVAGRGYTASPSASPAKGL